MAVKERLKEYISFKNISEREFCRTINVVGTFINNIKSSVHPDKLHRITVQFPDLNIEWLLTGEGDMLKGTNVQKIKEVKENRGFVGQMSGGSVDIHHDEGKDKVIEKQEREVEQMFKVLIDELHEFYEIGKYKDEYIKHQDEYLSHIIKESYLRNERNMERLDKVIEQQTKLIELVNSQSAKINDRADKLIDALIQSKIIDIN